MYEKMQVKGTDSLMAMVKPLPRRIDQEDSEFFSGPENRMLLHQCLQLVYTSREEV